MHSHHPQSVDEGHQRLGIRLPRHSAREIYPILKDNGLIDSSLIPIVEDGFICYPTQDFNQQQTELIVQSIDGAMIQTSRFALNISEPTPYQKLVQAIEQLLTEFGLETHELLEDIPTKWERLGSLILFPMDAFTGEKWEVLLERCGDQMWEQCCAALGSKAIGRQQPVAKTKTRDSQAEILFGKSWVEFSQHDTFFGFDASKVMFSSGNISERQRMTQMNVKNEIIIDAYAGIGYYSLPIAKHGQPHQIHAFEINPHSIRGLEWGVEKNQVAHLVQIHPGDNQETLKLFKGTADRCILGLLPRSTEVWDLAYECLKPRGGTLHIHMNVGEEHIESWIIDTTRYFESLCKQAGVDAIITPLHLEKVKWFAPRIRHIVLDLHIEILV